MTEQLQNPARLNAVEARAPRNATRSFIRILFRTWASRIAVAILAVVILFAVAAPLLPYGPDRLDLDHRYAGPNAGHLLGSDALGRDVLARLAFGGRVSLSVGVAASVITVVLGVLVGGIAGYAGGRLETLIMRTVDALYAFPSILFAIFISILIKGEGTSSGFGFIAVLANLDQYLDGLLAVFVAIAATGWLTSARLVRAEMLVIKKSEFVEASRLAGARAGFILRTHLIPNALPPVIVAATLAVPNAILLEAGLSFLGVGVNPPTPSWGLMVADGLPSLQAFPHLLLVPALAIGITLLSLNFLGDGLRDALDPTFARARTSQEDQSDDGNPIAPLVRPLGRARGE